MGRSTILAAAGALLATLSVAAPVAAGPIVGEWDPGLTEAEVGGPLVVDGYGVNGLGLYQVQLADGTTQAAVCVQADVGHSRSADYAIEPGSSFAAELGYLLWAHVRGGVPTDVEAAAINVLAWRYTDAQRRTGGPVWQGDDVEVWALGVGRLVDVEQAVGALHAEAAARRGPWAFSELVVADGSATIGITGPAGPIAGVPVTFAAAGWSTVSRTGPDGRATATVPPDVAAIDATAEAPGGAVALAAPGSQLLAVAGPPAVLASSALAPSPTTSTMALPPTTTTTTTPPPTTEAPSTTSPPPPSTSPPPMTSTVPSTTSTVLPSTTTTTTTPSTTAATPPTTSGGPPALPRTGGSSRGAMRIGSILFAAGAGAVLVAAPRRRVW